MKTLILSDLHINSPHFYNYDKVLSVLSEPWDRVILNGDILDQTKDAFLSNMSVEDVHLLQVIKRKNVIWIAGNHEPILQHTEIITRSWIEFNDSGRSIVVRHGHEYSSLSSGKYWLLETCIVQFQKWWDRLFRTNIQAFLRRLNIKGKPRTDGSTKEWLPHLTKVRNEAIKAHRGFCDVLVIGHNHLPEHIVMSDLEYLNSGTGVGDELSYVTVINGVPELHII
jgi:predicted phosphodiesterase